MDRLGQLIQRGRDATQVLWQAPDDAEGRAQVAALLLEIRAAGESQGKQEIPAICDRLGPAVNAAPTPHSVEILQDGFERLHRFWLATRSGLV